MISSAFYIENNEVKQNDLIIALTAALRVNNTAQAEFADARAFYSSAQWIDQMKTVHLNPGRRTGKTTAIVHLYERDDVVVCHNRSLKEYTIEMSQRLFGDKKDTSRIITIEDLYYWGQGQPTKLNRIFVDDCRLHAQDQVALDYLAIKHAAHQVVYIGER